MTSQKINIGPGTDIDLPDLVQSRLLIQANSGGGKTVIARVIIEESHGKIPFIVFDDAGEYYPLKEKYGDIVIIGGQYADVAISMQSVKMLPKFIIDNHLNVVIDLSDMKTTQRVLYVKEFLEVLMDLPQQYWKPYLVFIEEAHKYCGEQDKQPSAGAVKELLSGGRKKGYCGVLITQRIAKLHKDAAAECNNKFVGRTSLDIDMDRAAKELGFTASSEFTRLSLRDLKPGHFYAYGTSLHPHHVHEVSIKLPQTKIVKVGHIVDIKQKKPTQQLLSALARLNDLPKDAAKELKDVQALQAEVKRLATELKKKPAIAAHPKKDTENSVIADQLNKTKAYVFELQTKLTEQERLIKEWTKLAVSRKITLDKMYKMLFDAKEKQDGNIAWLLGEKERYPDPKKQKLTKNDKTKFVQKEFSRHIVNSNVNGSVLTVKPVQNTNGILPKGELRVLTACAQHKNGLNRKALTVITGYTRRTRDAYIFSLRNKGMAEIGNQDKIMATEEGITALGADFEMLPVGEDLQRYWLAELPQGEKVILEKLLEAHPKSLDRDTISELAGYTRRTRDAYIYNMLAKEIVEIPSKGQVKASDLLFD